MPAGLNWQTAAAPAFNVLGDLTLNAGSTVNYSFDNTISTKLPSVAL